MKTIALEEHFVLPQIRTGWGKINPELTRMFSSEITERLEDFAEGALRKWTRWVSRYRFCR